MTKIDLDELERKAREAIIWDKGAVAAAFRRANSPPVTLALIARIRELESAVRESAEEFLRNSEYPPEVADLYALLEKGAVLP
jgi:hypothetical protein